MTGISMTSFVALRPSRQHEVYAGTTPLFLGELRSELSHRSDATLMCAIDDDNHYGWEGVDDQHDGST